MIAIKGNLNVFIFKDKYKIDKYRIPKESPTRQN
jgi:hypothetical protein